MSTENSILMFSLKPIFTCMTVCGVPASNTGTHTFLKIIIHTTVLLSLFANVCCTIDALIKDFNRGLKIHLELIELPKENHEGTRCDIQIARTSVTSNFPFFIVRGL